MSKVIGIDLGTTNSCVSVIEQGKANVITNDEGGRTTPSIVAFSNGEIRVGAPAKRQAVVNSKNTIYSIKRLIGKKFSECGDEIKKLPYKVVDNGKDVPCVLITDSNGVEKMYTPQEISAMVLGKLKQIAEDYLGEKVTSAVITVPAYFNDAERQATIEAGEIAGLEVKRIVNEPTASALAFGLDKEVDAKIMVFDAGGGTMDVSILDISDGVFEVLSTDGDVHLGGDDFDHAIIDYVTDKINKTYNIDITKDSMALQRIREACERVKIELSSSMQSEVNLPYLTVIDGTPLNFQEVVTRSKFEQLTSDLVTRCIACAESALKATGLKESDLSEIILVGGTTRIPAIQEALEKRFGKKPNKSVNPDEVVAMGASVQGAVLTGEMKDILLLDVTPLSLGIETYGGVFTKLIPANTTIPTSKTETFSTASDNQENVEVHVLQGEREFAKDNRSLGRFQLGGIPLAPRGVPKIDVTLNIDANGVVSVTAKDNATGKENSITIQGGSQLSKEEIERMKMEAEMNAESDKKEREKVDKINRADSFVFNIEKQMKEFSDKISETDKGEIDTLLADLKSSIESKDIEKLDESMSKLESKWTTIITAIYQNQNESQNQSSSVEDESTSDTQDVDYEEIK